MDLSAGRIYVSAFSDVRFKVGNPVSGISKEVTREEKASESVRQCYRTEKEDASILLLRHPHQLLFYLDLVIQNVSDLRFSAFPSDDDPGDRDHHNGGSCSNDQDSFVIGSFTVF